MILVVLRLDFRVLRRLELTDMGCQLVLFDRTALYSIIFTLVFSVMILVVLYHKSIFIYRKLELLIMSFQPVVFDGVVAFFLLIFLLTCNIYSY